MSSRRLSEVATVLCFRLEIKKKDKYCVDTSSYL